MLSPFYRPEDRGSEGLVSRVQDHTALKGWTQDQNQGLSPSKVGDFLLCGPLISVSIPCLKHSMAVLILEG